MCLFFMHSLRSFLPPLFALWGALFSVCCLFMVAGLLRNDFMLHQLDGQLLLRQVTLCAKLYFSSRNCAQALNWTRCIHDCIMSVYLSVSLSLSHIYVQHTLSLSHLCMCSFMCDVHSSSTIAFNAIRRWRLTPFPPPSPCSPAGFLPCTSTCWHTFLVRK